MSRTSVRQLDDLRGRFVIVGEKRGHVTECSDTHLTVLLWTSQGPQRELPDKHVTVLRSDPSWRLMYPPKKRSPA